MAISDIDLNNLDEKEFKIISRVLHRDRTLRIIEENRLLPLKMELQSLRRRGALRQGLDTTRCCARCTSELGRLINRGALCAVCRKKVCKACRQYGDVDKQWVCVVCRKQMEFKATSGEWMQEFSRRSSKRRVRRIPAGDVLLRAILETRRKGSINRERHQIRKTSDSKSVNAERLEHQNFVPDQVERHGKHSESPFILEIRKQFKKLELSPLENKLFNNLKRSESQPALDEKNRFQPISPVINEITRHLKGADNNLVQEIKRRFRHSEPESESVDLSPEPIRLKKISKSAETLAEISRNYQIEEMEKMNLIRKLSKPDNSSSSSSASPDYTRKSLHHQDSSNARSRSTSSDMEDRWIRGSITKRSPTRKERPGGDTDSAYSTSPRATHLKPTDTRPTSGSASSISESEVEKSTGVIFRKVTLKKRKSNEEREKANSALECPYNSGCDTNTSFPINDRISPTTPNLGEGNNIFITFSHTDTRLEGTEDLERYRLNPEYYRIVVVPEENEITKSPKILRVTSRFQMYGKTLCIEDSDWELCSDCEDEFSYHEKQNCQITAINLSENYLRMSPLFNGAAPNRFRSRPVSYLLKENGSRNDLSPTNAREMKSTELIRPDQGTEVARSSSEGSSPPNVLNSDDSRMTVEQQQQQLLAGNLNQTTCNVGSMLPSDEANVNNDEGMTKNEEALPFVVSHGLDQANSVSVQNRLETDIMICEQNRVESCTREVTKLNSVDTQNQLNRQISTVWKTESIMAGCRCPENTTTTWEESKLDSEIPSGGEELDKLESDTDSQDTVIERESYGRMRSLALKEKILQANEELMKMDSITNMDIKWMTKGVEEEMSFPLQCESVSYEKEDLNHSVMNSMHELISCIKSENCEKSWHFSDNFKTSTADNLELNCSNEVIYGVSDSLLNEPTLPCENKNPIIISARITEVEHLLDQHAVENLQGNEKQEINTTFCIKSDDGNNEDDVFLTDSSSDEFTYSSYSYNAYDCHPLPHVLHTITEESCEESEKNSQQTVTTHNLKRRMHNDNLEESKMLTTNKDERDLETESDTISETSESTYNENNNNNNRNKENLKNLAISRLEKYFSSGLSEAGHFCYPDDSELTDESGGISSSDDETSVNQRIRTASVSSIGTEISESEYKNQNTSDPQNPQNIAEILDKELSSDNITIETNKLDKSYNPSNKVTYLPEWKKLIIEKETNHINKTELPVNYLKNHFNNSEKEEILNDVQNLFKELFVNQNNHLSNSVITECKCQKGPNRNLSPCTLSKSKETNFESTKQKSEIVNKSKVCVTNFSSNKLTGSLSENNFFNCNNNSLDNWKLLELQIAKLMQTVSPLSLSAEEPSSSSCSSTIGSNNSDYGSDTLESEEESVDSENNVCDYKNSFIHSDFDSNKIITPLQSNLIVPLEFNNESTISEETLYICKQLMASLKKITSESIFDSNENNQNQESDMIHARQYIKNQIIALMHTVNVSRNNSPLRERRERHPLNSTEIIINPNDTQDSSDVESPKPMIRKSSVKSKTSSESGSETTVSASISIPSFDDSDNTPTESEISHEMDELFALLENSNGSLSESLVMKSHIHSERNSTTGEEISFSSNDTLINSKNKSKDLSEQLVLERDHTNSEKCNNFLLYLDSNYDPNEYCKNQVPIWRDNMCNNFKSLENKHQNIEVTFISSTNTNNDPSKQNSKVNFLSNTDEANKTRSQNIDIFTTSVSTHLSNYNILSEKPSNVQINISSDSKENIDILEYSEDNSNISYDISRQSFESVREMPISEIQENKQSTLISVSLNNKEKACSENDLLAVNYEVSKKNVKVLATKSTGNISELDTENNKNAFRDTGYYSFKSSEESILSLEDLPNSPSSTSLTFYRSLTSTKAIPEVEAESSTSKSMPSMSLSSGNIPREVNGSSSNKSSTLPLSVRAKLYMPPATRPRTFTSSFFSTSGVLRKLTALRDESNLSHRPSPHGRLRVRGRSLSGGSDDCKQENASVPQISVCDYTENASRQNSTASSDKVSASIQDDDVDQVFSYSRSQLSLSSFAGISESMTSVYSAAGGGRYGTVVVSGEVLFGLSYNYKASCMEVHIKECRNLAAVDTRKNRSDPYTKVYLLPDRTKSGKRKTKVKKHTLNPNFDEILKFPMTISELETRTLWLSIWHSDMFGRNDFLGEVMLPLGYEVFENPGLRWYPLQERLESLDSPISYKGDLNLALKYVPPDVTMQKPSKRSGRPAKGSLHVLVKEARNLMAVRSNGTSDPFCKSYLLPDKSKSGKQKTHVIKKTCNPKWNHTFVYDDVSIEDLHDRCLELTIWDYDKITSNDFLGGVRLNLGTGKYEGRDVEWMDSQGEEMIVWRSVLDKPNMWIDCSLLLRSSMQSRRTL